METIVRLQKELAEAKITISVQQDVRSQGSWEDLNRSYQTIDGVDETYYEREVSRARARELARYHQRIQQYESCECDVDGRGGYDSRHYWRGGRGERDERREWGESEGEDSDGNSFLALSVQVIPPLSPPLSPSFLRSPAS